MKNRIIILLFLGILFGIFFWQKNTFTQTELSVTPSDTLLITKKYVVRGKSTGEIKIIKYDRLDFYEQWKIIYTNNRESVITTEKEVENLTFT